MVVFAEHYLSDVSVAFGGGGGLYWITTKLVIYDFLNCVSYVSVYAIMVR